MADEYNVMGEAERLVLNATEGAGLHRDRRRPDGPQRIPLACILLAAILFGFLYQGGAELALWTSTFRVS